MASSASTIHVEQVIVLEGITPDEAWRWVADTDWVNRVSGLPAYSSRTLIESVHGNSRERMTTRWPPLEWEEGPFEFVCPRRHVVRRRFRRGPLSTFEGGMELVPTDAGTRVRIFTDVVPRPAFLASIIRAGIERQVRRTARAITRAVGLRASAGRWARGGVAPISAAAAQRLEGALARIEADPRLSQSLRALVCDAPDEEAVRLRPFEIADHWHAPRLDVLRLFLRAARAGIVDMSWDLLCPHCHVPTLRRDSLSQLEARNSCPSCDLEFGADFDTAVEVTFRVNAAVRELHPGEFCRGAPAKRRSHLVQVVLQPGESREIGVDLKEGDYVLFRADLARGLTIRACGGPSSAEIAIGEDSVTGPAGAQAVEVAAGPLRLTLRSEMAQAARVNLASATPTPDGASAAMVTMLQDFRDLFSVEVLGPDVHVAIASVTLLFTDLTGSTALYETHGEGRMFPLIRDHFGELAASVSAEGGGVVKTIGDAIMAALPSPAAGVRAALDMQARIRRLNAATAPGGAPPLSIKIGLHCGPCLAVTANDRLDYFGNAVNIAARVEGKAAGGEVVMTSAVATDPEVAAILAGSGLRLSPFEAELKGLSAPLSLLRVGSPVVRSDPSS